MGDVRRWTALSGLCFAFLLPHLSLATGQPPVFIGLDAEFGHRTSTSAQAIQQGIEIAIDEINASGGVLGGRPLKLLIRDNRSLPARARANLLDLLQVPDLVAVFCGKFSPTVLEVLSLVHEHRLIVLNPWAAADDIIDNGYDPNYVFRLSLRDRWAMASLLRHAEKRSLQRVGFLLPNTSWGRSNQRALEAYLTEGGRPLNVGIHWFNWGEKPLLPKYQRLVQASAEAVVLVANEAEGAQLIQEVAQLPQTAQRPILAHWGVTGGDLAALAGEALHRVDFSVVQTFSFVGNPSPRAKRILAALQTRYGLRNPERVTSPVGLAHAYDLTHILARAINLAGTTDRPQVRAALETVRDYDGLIKRYAQPFSSTRHEALEPRDLFIARYRGDGALVPLEKSAK
jgi:branched-chain amino acid transport system substrate-binding protein